MKNAILLLAVLVLANSLFSTCEYNGIKTKSGYNYFEPGVKSEYANEEFVMLVDPKAIKNLDQLKGLACLEYGEFYDQMISGDLANLKELINLKVFSLHTNPEVYGNICAFSKATNLKSLKMAFDEKVYGDISCLNDLNLETFAMTYAQISGDLSDLSHMTNLKALYLTGTNISGNISALSNLTNLEELTLCDSEMDGSRFYGDLAVLDNLKKLRKAALYNLNATNCEHFHQTHPDIEGGCSSETRFTVKDSNVKSERMIGKESNIGKDEAPEQCVVNGEFIGEEQCKTLVGNNYEQDQESRNDDGPPKECIVDGKFIGESACRALMDKNSEGQGRQPSNGIEAPPEECMVEGKFIEEEKCRALVGEKPTEERDNRSQVQQNKTSPVSQEKSKPQIMPTTKKSLWQQIIDWVFSFLKKI